MDLNCPTEPSRVRLHACGHTSIGLLLIPRTYLGSCLAYDVRILLVLS